MTIKGFDYKAFAEDLASQAGQLVPADFKQNEKEYVTTTLLNFATMAGEALYQDQDNLGFSADQAAMITQIIAEWAFHKSVDLIRSGIPQQYWNSIIQKILVTIFEVAKQAFKQNLPQEQILQVIEHHVKRVYTESIAELKDKDIISAELMEKASAQSNIDTVIQQMEEEEEKQAEQAQKAQNKKNPPKPEAQNVPQQAPAAQPAPAPQPAQQNMPAVQEPADIAQPINTHYIPPKILKLVTIAMLLKRIDDEEQIQEILDCLKQEDAGTVIRYMYTDGVEDEVEPGATVKMLEAIAEKLPEALEVNKKHVIERLQKIVKSFGKKRMERKLQYERHKTRQLVFNALDGEYYNVSPKIANIIATYLENIV